MAVDYGNLFQGLGAMAMAFADPRQSLMMSQGVYRNLELARERKRRQEEQAENIRRWNEEQAVRQGRLDLAPQEFEAQQAAQPALRDRGTTALAMIDNTQPLSVAGAMPPPAPPQMQPAMYTPGAPGAMMQPGPLGAPAIPPMPQMQPRQQSPHRARRQAYAQLQPGAQAAVRDMLTRGDTEGAFRYMAEQNKPLDPTAEMRNFEAYANMTPAGRELLAQYRQSGRAQTNINMPGAAPPNPHREHPRAGKAKEGTYFNYNPADPNADELGYVNVTREVGGRTVTVPEVIDTGMGERSAETVKTAALAASGRQSIQQARELMAGNAWDDLTTKVGFITNWAGSRGSEIKRYIYDAYDTLSKLRTGAASTAKEEDNYNRIFGLSVLHSAADAERRLAHLERAHAIYDEARNRTGTAEGEALPADVEADVMTRVMQDPAVNPYALEGLEFVGHTEQGVKYNLPSGRIFHRGYHQFDQ